MPKETISTPVGPYHAKVGWSPARGVQVGVESDDQRSLFWLLLGNDPESLARLGEVAHTIGQQFVQRTEAGRDETAEEAGRLLLNSLDARTPHYAGVWSDLDRHGCNELIRILRRARDSAFGRDE